MTRIASLIAGNKPIAQPPLDSCEYLLTYLYEVGPVMQGGMGQTPLTHEEIAHWQRNIGLSLQPWEARFLKSLSREYLSQSQISNDINCPPPFGAIERAKNIDKLIDEAFG